MEVLATEEVKVVAVTEAAAMAAAAMAAARAAVMMAVGLAEEVRAVVKVVACLGVRRACALCVSQQQQPIS